MTIIRGVTSLAALAIAAAAQAQGLPDGDGKKLVEAYCQECHDLSTVTRSGYSREAWKNNVHMMLNVGAKVPAGEVDAVVDYLAKALPERPMPPAVIVPGDVKVAFREWFVPTPGSRPHDPLVTRDGMLWYSGQFANVLGRLDPRTGQFREFRLKPDNSGPHGLVADAQGDIWYTANFKAYIGRLDPKTGDVREYPMPDPASARDPHTPIFDREGTLWFTVQSGNKVGRLEPKSGALKVVESPTPRSRPYGIQVDAHDVPWFVEFGTNKVARIDRDTMAIHEYALPDAASRPRRLAIGSDGAIWYSDYARGYLGRLDPKSGQVSEWPSPGGRNSLPYGILAQGDAIWYSESGVKPNTLVRFDTKAHKFQTWAIPSGGGVVRNMVVAPDGELALALSGVNGIALVKIE
jgi:virginiamycin B lyase